RPGSCLLTTSMPESCPSSFVDQMQGAALVGGDVIGLVALDLVLRFLRRSTATVALVVEVGGVDLRDGPRDLPGLGVPSHMVTDREFARHDSSSSSRMLCFHPSTKGPGAKPVGPPRCGRAVRISRRTGRR